MEKVIHFYCATPTPVQRVRIVQKTKNRRYRLHVNVACLAVTGNG